MSSRKRRRPEGAVEGEEDGPIELSSTSGTSHASQPSSSLSNTLSSPHKKRLLHGTSDSDANMQHQTSQGAHSLAEIPHELHAVDATPKKINAIPSSRPSAPGFITSSPMTAARRLSDEFLELAQTAPENAPLALPSNQLSSSSTTQQGADVDTRITLEEKSIESHTTETSSHRPSHAHHDQGQHHASLNNPHGDQVDEANTSIMNSIFSPGLVKSVLKPFHALTSSLGVRSSSQDSESSSAPPTPRETTWSANTSYIDAASKVRLPAPNGVHHAAYRRRPHQHNLGTPLRSSSSSIESGSHLEDVQTQSRTVTPLSSSQSIELVVPPSKTEEEEDAYDSSVSTTRHTDRSSSSVGNKLSEDSRDAVDRLETVHELNESKEVNSELEDESGNGEVKPLAQSQAELSIDEDIMVEIVDDTEETRDDEEEEGSDEVSEEEFDSYLFMANVPPLASLKPPPVAPPSLPLKPRHAPKVTLVLDLDETLVHCSLEKIDNPDLIFAVPYEGEEFQVYVRKRPGFEQFLSRVSELFEVAVFTASQKAYADKLLNILDPTHKWIHHRLFRESCVQVLGNYLKDLNVLGRELSKVVIVDNSPHVFAYQVDNGVPIESWYNDSRDRELLHLLPFLETLAKCSDVRPMIRNKFHTHKKVEESLRAYNEVVQAAHEPSERRSRMKSHLRRRRQSQNDEKEETENPAEEVAQEELIEGDGLEPGTPLVSEDGVDTPKAEEVETAEDDEDSTASRRSSRRTSTTTTTKRVRSVYTMNASTKKSASSAVSSSSNVEAQTAQKTRSSTSSRRQSVVEGDSSDENGESEKTERTSPAPAPRRKARIRSRLPLADESDSDAELVKVASPPAKKVAKRR